MPRANLLSLFNDFHRQGRDAAVVQRRGYRRESWTYAKLAKVAFVCEQELKRRGLRSGDRVLLWGPNSAQWMAAFWGCLLRGAVAVPIDDGAMPDFATRVTRETSPKLIFASTGKPALDPAIPTLNLEDLSDRPSQPYVVVATTLGPGQTPPLLYQSLPDEPITRNHIAQILFTSGTTAEPRGVVLTHGNFLANIEPLSRGIDPYRKYERWFHPLRFVSLVPLSHVFGQFMALFVPALLGSTVVFESSGNASEVVRSLKRERATALITVPHMLDLLRNGIMRDLEARGETKWFEHTFAAARGQKFLRRVWMFRRIHRRFGWKFWAFISGGAALASDTEDFFKRLGYAVVQGYGMTETASLISLNHPFRATQGSIGKVLPGREFRLAEDGEILVRGENVASGYWQKGALQRSTTSQENSGWLRTGDVGELDAEGNLRFRGRKKNVIVTPAGLNIYPEDLEASLRKQPGVRDCVVIPQQRDGNSEPLAALLLQDPSAAAASRAIEDANRSLAEYQRMRHWLIWPDPDFPRTPTGKPKLAEIAARAKEISNTPQNVNQATVRTAGRVKDSLSKSGDSVSALLAKFSAGNQTQILDRDLNLTSLDRVELMSALEQRYQVELNETAFAEAKTVSDVQTLLRQPSARRSEYVYPRWTQREPIRWLRLAMYYALIWPATQLLGHPKILGGENLRNLNGPVLVISNHITRRADIGLILAALPPRFRHRLAVAMGGESLQRMRRPPREWFFAKRCAYQLGYALAIALFNVFPLPQFSGFRESFRYAGESVDRGYSVLVFPEGEVNNTETGAMAAFQSGIGVLAQNLRVPIIPVRLDGVWQMKREHRRLAHRGEIAIRIGAPITFPLDTPPDEIAKDLRSIVGSL